MTFDNEEQKPETSQRRSRISNPTPYSGLGKLPPQATDLEELVLGAIMLENTIPMTVWNTIRPEFFYKDSHQLICRAIFDMRFEKLPIDISTVTARLRKMGSLEMVGGAYYITELTNRVASSANIEYHLLIVHQMYMKRELIRMGMECAGNMYDDTTDPFDEIKSILKQLATLERGIFKRTEKDAKELVQEAIKEMTRPKPKGLLGISTGLRGIDKITQGDQPGQLRIVAARPAMGKTAYMCSEILACVYNFKNDKFLPAEEQIPVGCFSLEMRGVQLTFRMLSSVSQIDNLKIKKNQLTNDEYIRFVHYSDQYQEAPIFIDDTPGISIDEVVMKIAIWVALYGVKKVYIDYIQLMKGIKGKNYRGNRDQEVGDISRELKTCASDLGITIIALAQLSREVEKRRFCKPQLSDLRESGSIEQDADVVQFLWRPEYYPHVMDELLKPEGNITIDPYNYKITSYSGLIIAIIAKCREEQTGYIPLTFKGSIMQVCDHKEFLHVLDQHELNINALSEGDAPF